MTSRGKPLALGGEVALPQCLLQQGEEMQCYPFCGDATQSCLTSVSQLCCLHRLRVWELSCRSGFLRSHLYKEGSCCSRQTHGSKLPCIASKGAGGGLGLLVESVPGVEEAQVACPCRVRWEDNQVYLLAYPTNTTSSGCDILKSETGLA